MATRIPRSSLGALLEPIGSLSPRRELTMILLLAAETMVVYIYGGVLLAETSPPFEPLPATLLFTLFLIAYQVPHLLETMRLWTPEYETIMLAGLAGTFLLTLKVGAFPEAPWFSLTWISGSLDALILRPNDAVRPVWGLVLLLLYVWWRGRSRAEPVLDTAYGMLRWGTIFTAGGLVLVWLSASPDAVIVDTLNIAVIGFVVFSLLAIAVSRQPSIEESPEWSAAWIWIFVFVLPIGAIAATTMSTAGVLSRETLDIMLSILAPIFWAIGLALRALVLLIAVVAFILLMPLLWFLDRQGFGPFSAIPRIDIAPRTASDVNQFAETTLNIADPVRYLIAGIILALLGWILIRFIFRRRKFWSEQRSQQRESLIEWEEHPGTLLRKAGTWLSSKLRRDVDPYGGDPRWDANRRIRRAYRAFLRLARRHGISRSPNGTPNQFARELSRRFGPLAAPSERITALYNQARYAGRPMPVERATDAEAATAEVRDRLRDDADSLNP